MDDLIDLTLGGASSVRSLEPLAHLHRLESLHIESLRYARDLSPLRHLTSFIGLEIGGDWRSPRIAHVDSIAFLADMPQLRDLVIHSMIVDSMDDAALLHLPQLKTAARDEGARDDAPVGGISGIYSRTAWPGPAFAGRRLETHSRSN